MRVIGAPPANLHETGPWAAWAARAGCQVPPRVTAVSVRAAGAMQDDQAPEEPAEGGNDVTVRINGLIGGWWGLDAQALIRRLDYLQPLSRLRVLIESPGGFVDDALALWADFHARSRDGVQVDVEGRGVVASAAVLPFLAGDTRGLIAGSLMMLHEPWIVYGSFSGTRAEIRTTLERADAVLEADAKAMAEVLELRTSADQETRDRWLTCDCWLNGEEAVAAGLAHEVLAGDDGDPDPEPEPEPEPAAAVDPPPDPRPTSHLAGRMLRLRT